MFKNIKIESGTKLQAGVSVELSLTMAMIAIVVFVALIMFANSVNAMITNSTALKNFFHKSDKVETALLKDNPNSSGVQSQVNVEVVASQGLQKLIAGVADKLEMYNQKLDNGETLSSTEQMDYARQMLALYTANKANEKVTVKSSDGSELNLNFNLNSLPNFITSFGQADDSYYVDIYNKQSGIKQELSITTPAESNNNNIFIASAQKVLTEAQYQVIGKN